MSSSGRPVLIVDGMNMFVRSYTSYPTMSSHGHQIGGCVGFLKTLRRLVSEVQPSAVYVAWEGGGSQRRRALYSEYKLNRRPEKLNRFYGDDIPDSDDNKKHQLLRLLAMLKCVPVCQVYAQDCEGDDVVAYLCRGPFLNADKVIVSSDKDMYQLLDDSTRIYSLHKKTYIVAEDVLTEFRITAGNFALAKALCGDPSDNVPGVKGVGFKTAARLYPFLGTDQHILLEDVFNYAAAHRDSSNVHRRVLDARADVERNWRLVHLDGSMLSGHQVSIVDNLIRTFVPRADRMGLARMLAREGVGDFDVDGFFYAFICIDGAEHSS